MLSIDVSILTKSCHFSEPTRKAGSNLNRFKMKRWSLKMLALYQQNRENIGTSSCIPVQSYFLPPLEFSPTPIWECRTSEGQQVTQWIRNVVAPRLSLESLFPESPPLPLSILAWLGHYWSEEEILEDLFFESHFVFQSEQTVKCWCTNWGSSDAAHEKVGARVPLRDFANRGPVMGRSARVPLLG